ncbi:hypothetical protein CHUAL_008488 [Chamberlinius hualienensis]
MGSADGVQLEFRLFKPESSVNEVGSLTGSGLLEDVSLKNGMPLPEPYRKQFPSKLFGQPLHEIDPYYQGKKTFVVISRGWEIHRFSSESAFGCLDVFNWLRWLSIKIITNCIFTIVMVVTMFFYSVTVSSATYSYSRGPHVFRITSLVIFIIEIIIKLIGRGVIRHPFSYFRCPWNCLDVVCTTVMGVVIGLIWHDYVDYINLMLAIESLRLLKWIQLFPLAKASFAASMKNILLLRDLFAYVAFVVTAYTLYALNSYQGAFRHSCQGPYNISSEINVCGYHVFSNECPVHLTCEPDSQPNPEHGYMGYDHFGLALLNVLRVFTKDYWEIVFYYLNKAYGPSVIMFFSSLIILGWIFYNMLASHIAIGTGQFIGHLKGKHQPGKHGNSIESTAEEDTNKRASSSDNAEGVNGENTPSGEIEIQIDTPTLNSDNGMLLLFFKILLSVLNSIKMVIC